MVVWTDYIHVLECFQELLQFCWPASVGNRFPDEDWALKALIMFKKLLPFAENTIDEFNASVGSANQMKCLGSQKRLRQLCVVYSHLFCRILEVWLSK